MNYRRSIAAVGLAGVLVFAACGTDEQVAVPAAQPEVAVQDANAAYQYYYDVTHPAPQTKFNGDAKDHTGYGQITPASDNAAGWPGDAKDHPRYGSSAGGSIRFALRAPVRPAPEDFRTAFQAELSELVAREGLTGLSPAFLQEVAVDEPDHDIWGTPR